MITYEQTLEALKEIAASKPEGYRYTDENTEVRENNCFYFDRANDEPVDAAECVMTYDDTPNYDSPACLVGHVFKKFGLESLVNPSNNANVAIVGVFPRTQDTFEPKAYDLLAKAQEFQDEARPWVDAIKLAEKEVSLL